MTRLLVATDFSPRSDRAVQRAVVLARQLGGEIVVMHVIDDDCPASLASAERKAATALLDALVRNVCRQDRLPCRKHLASGIPHEAVVEATEALAAGLVVMGAHRRQALRRMFVGTTVERTIRTSRRPVLMVNAAPAGPYRRVLLATDFSDCSLAVVDAATRLGLLDGARVTALHVFDASARTLALKSWASPRFSADPAGQTEARAAEAMTTFLTRAGLKRSRQVIAPSGISTGWTILQAARRARADLIVVGTRGLSEAERLLLGSVAEEVLTESGIDVLVVPPAGAGEGA